MKVNSVGTGLTIRSRADAVDIANWVKFYGRHMLDMREKKTELAKQVEEKEKVKADLQRVVLDECGLLEVEISTTTSEIYALEKKYSGSSTATAEQKRIPFLQATRLH